MSEELKKVFSDNLRYLLRLRDKSQADLCKYMGISSATASDWCNGKKMPRSDKLQSIANWLGVDLAVLLQERATDTNAVYYTDPETAAIAQEIFDDHDLRALFDAGRGASPQDLQMAADLLRRLKKTNPDG